MKQYSFSKIWCLVCVRNILHMLGEDFWLMVTKCCLFINVNPILLQHLSSRYWKALSLFPRLCVMWQPPGRIPELHSDKPGCPLCTLTHLCTGFCIAATWMSGDLTLLVQGGSGVLETLIAGGKQTWFRFWLCPLLNWWPWTEHLTLTLTCLTFFYIGLTEKKSPFQRLFWGLNEIMHVKCQAK